MEWSFWNSRKLNQLCHLDEKKKKTLILKNPTGPFPSNKTNKEGNPVGFLRLQLNSSDYYRDEPNPEYEP